MNKEEQAKPTRTLPTIEEIEIQSKKHPYDFGAKKLTAHQEGRKVGYSEGFEAGVIWTHKNDFIRTAVNACKQISPSNPMAVAEGMGEIVEALKQAQAYLSKIIPPTKEALSIQIEIRKKSEAALSKIQGVAKEEGE